MVRRDGSLTYGYLTSLAVGLEVCSNGESDGPRRSCFPFLLKHDWCPASWRLTSLCQCSNRVSALTSAALRTIAVKLSAESARAASAIEQLCSPRAVRQRDQGIHLECVPRHIDRRSDPTRDRSDQLAAFWRLTSLRQRSKRASAVTSVASCVIAVAAMKRSAGSLGRSGIPTASNAMSPVSGNSTMPASSNCARSAAGSSRSSSRPLVARSAISQKLMALMAKRLSARAASAMEQLCSPRAGSSFANQTRAWVSSRIT